MTFYPTYDGQQLPMNKSVTKVLDGSLSSNLIGQNGYFAGMRPLRDSGNQFADRLLLYGSPSEVR